MAVSIEKSVLRKVFFFRVSEASATLENIRAAIEHISSLEFNDQGRYLPTVSEDIVHAVYVSKFSFPIRIQFGRIRRSDLPLIENQGDISPLNIARSAGVLDWAHIVIFDDGIVAAEFNRDAPRLARLGEYLYFKARGILENSPKFFPLFEKSVLSELSKFESVTLLEVEAPTSESESISQADGNLGLAFQACRLAGNPKTAKLTLKSSRPQSGLDLKELAKRLFTNSRSREALTNLRITGKTDKGRRPLDMLEDYLISSENFIRLDARSRAISSKEAFQVIESAYKDNHHRFAGAATATDWP